MAVILAGANQGVDNSRHNVFRFLSCSPQLKRNCFHLKKLP